MHHTDSLPLQAITVVDLTRVVAGPSATRTLCDLGATVLKIEPPDGDLLRQGVPKVSGVAVGFTQLNTGKRMLSIDLQQVEGQRLVQRLVDRADVLVENYRPGVTTRLGLDFASASARNPGLVYCSISGYGQDGPAASRRAYAPIIHAELGLLDLNARERETEPLPEAVSHADFAVGAQAATAILAALLHRQATGRGQHIDVSMAETMLAMNEWTAVEVNGGFGGQISPFRPGRAALLKLPDGAWVQVPGNPTTWIFGVARALGKQGELEQRGWLTPADTQGHEQAIKALMQSWAAEFPSVRAFEAALDAARIPLGQVKPLAGTLHEDWALARGAFVAVRSNDEDAEGAQVQVPRSPWRFSASPGIGPRTGTCLRGAHNRSELSERLGLDAAQLDLLEQTGVLCRETSSVSP
ncbi:MAG: CaiB/BaiF CoA-transferase family protein [Pseudomonadales bacterium]|nr:CoA transferase [Pseudomonadales bacterium]